MMKKLLILCCVLFGSISMFAQHRSEQEAIQIAQDFFKPRQAAKEARLAVVPQQEVQAKMAKMVKGSKRAAATQNSSCYIINDEANNRFVIVSADERMYKILGYSDNGIFDAQKAPEGLMELINGYESQYDFFLTNGEQVIKQTKAQKVEAIEPMLKTKWNQLRPYFNDCPIDSRYDDYSNYEETYEKLGVNIRSVTGCAATAMAQIMNYHKYPQSGTGSSDYTTTLGSHQTMDFSTITFDWDNMLDEYDSDFGTDVHKEAVAELMHACGVSVRMDYTKDGSGALSIDVAYALINHFKYNPNIKYYLRNYFSNAEWNSIILNDLRQGLPVFYGGQTKTYDEEGNERKDDDGNYILGGHGFVIDGCDKDLLYHINFGYSGEYDGYYSLDALTLKEGTNYELNQEMICNISPNVIGTKEDVFFTQGFYMFDVSGSTAMPSFSQKRKTGERVGFGYSSPINACNSSNSYNKSFSGEIGFGLFDIDLNFIKSLKKETIYSFEGLYAGNGYQDQAAIFYLWSSDFKNGNQYVIAPYAKSNDSEKPTIIYASLWNSYLATVSNDSVSISSYSEPSAIVVDDQHTLAGETAKIQINFNNNNTSYKGFQFDLKLPEGFSIAKGADDLYEVALTNRCSGENIDFYVANIEGNVYRVSVFNTEISASTGSILEIAVTAPDVKEGSYGVTLGNIYFVKPNGKMVDLKDCKFEIIVDSTNPDIVPGDANGDGIVDVADIVYIVNHIMGNPASDFNFKNADVDKDGVIDVADITLVVNIIMQANASQSPAYANSIFTGLKLAELGDGKVVMNILEGNNYVASQFDVVVPIGASICDISLNSNVANSHEIKYNKIGSNRYRVVVYSSNNNIFGNNGELLTITTSNTGTVSVENAVCVTNSGMKIGYANTESQTTGIKNISTVVDNSSVYSIDGREVKQKNLSKGIYIINGKKHVVK